MTKHTVAIVLLIAGLLVILGDAFHEVEKRNTEMGFAMDDAWIHASIAKNFISGKGYGINDGHWIPLSTAPAWTLIMSAFMLVLRDPFIATMAAAAACQIAAVILAYLLLFRLTSHRFWSFLGAALLTVHPILLWGYPSGMEHPVVTLAVVALLYVHERYPAMSRGRLIGMPLVLLLCVLSRPELFVVVPFAILITAYQSRVEDLAGNGEVFKRMVISSAIFAVGILPYFIFNYATTGHLFPTAFFVKTAMRNVGFSGALMDGDWGRALDMVKDGSIAELIGMFELFMRMNPFMALLVPVGIVSFFPPFRRGGAGRGSLFILLVIVLPLILGIVAPSGKFSNYMNRYLAPFVPGLVLLSALGLWAIWSEGRRRFIGGFCAVLIVLFAAKGYDPIIDRYARDVENTNWLYVHSGTWISENIDPSVTIAINDIGGISYFCDNPIIDVMGLASPEIWPYLTAAKENRSSPNVRAAAIKRYLHEQKIDYILISPRYYPMIDKDTVMFERVKVWNAATPTQRSIDPQILYRINWEHYVPPAEPAI